MISDPMLVPTVMFWILAPLVAILPARLSVVAYLLLVQVDLSGLGNFSTTSMGMENVIRVVIIPTILLFKIRKYVHLDGTLRKFVGAWLLLVAYACLTTLWSPYRVSAFKMNGYFYAYSVLFLVFVVAWQHKWLTPKILMFVVWASLLGATIQTYFLGNAFGSDVDQFRFTTFTGAQSFAPFLLCLLVLLLFHERPSIPIFTTALAASLGLLLTGSRSIFLGFVWVLLTYGAMSAVRSGKRIRFGLILKRVSLTIAAIALLLIIVVKFMSENRLNEMLAATVEKNATVEDVGTFGWRLALYQETLAQLASRSWGTLLVGSGTSSGANLVLDEGIYQEDNVDPNRALHDEFLRVVYEWGFLGLFAFLFFLTRISKLGWNMAMHQGSLEAWAFLAIFVPLLITLTFENILADSGSPGGVGYNLVISSMMAAYCSTAGNKQRSVAKATSGILSRLPNPAHVLSGH